jgi:phosphoenolpyruvate carboxykinase (ATP)
MNGDLDNVEYIVDPRFGFEVPVKCPNVPEEVLQPRKTWADTVSFDTTADKLAAMFNENFARYEAGVSAEVNAAAPQPLV